MQVASEARESAVTVYLDMVLQKDFGLLARLAGNRNVVERSRPYDMSNPWWENPLVVYSDPPLGKADTTGEAESLPILGRGKSSNVSVQVSLVPHAEVAFRSVQKSDGIKGTITLAVSAAAEYYDGGWIPMVREDGRKMTFAFDTRDANRIADPVAHERRTVSRFAFERYTRDRQRWEPQSQWPAEPKSGDWRAVIIGTDATLDVTGYRYIDGPLVTRPTPP